MLEENIQSSIRSSGTIDYSSHLDNKREFTEGIIENYTNIQEYVNETSIQLNQTSDYPSESTENTTGYLNLTTNYTTYSNDTTEDATETSEYSSVTPEYSTTTTEYSAVTSEYSTETPEYSTVTTEYSTVTTENSSITTEYSVPTTEQSITTTEYFDNSTVYTTENFNETTEYTSNETTNGYSHVTDTTISNTTESHSSEEKTTIISPNSEGNTNETIDNKVDIETDNIKEIKQVKGKEKKKKNKKPKKLEEDHIDEQEKETEQNNSVNGDFDDDSEEELVEESIELNIKELEDEDEEEESEEAPIEIDKKVTESAEEIWNANEDVAKESEESATVEMKHKVEPALNNKLNHSNEDYDKNLNNSSKEKEILEVAAGVTKETEESEIAKKEPTTLNNKVNTTDGDIKEYNKTNTDHDLTNVTTEKEILGITMNNTPLREQESFSKNGTTSDVVNCANKSFTNHTNVTKTEQPSTLPNSKIETNSNKTINTLNSSSAKKIGKAPKPTSKTNVIRTDVNVKNTNIEKSSTTTGKPKQVQQKRKPTLSTTPRRTINTMKMDDTVSVDAEDSDNTSSFFNSFFPIIFKGSLSRSSSGNTRSTSIANSFNTGFRGKASSSAVAYSNRN